MVKHSPKILTGKEKTTTTKSQAEVAFKDHF